MPFATKLPVLLSSTKGGTSKRENLALRVCEDFTVEIEIRVSNALTPGKFIYFYIIIMFVYTIHTLQLLKDLVQVKYMC